LGRQFEGRISCRQVDLNFASFETGAYDVALSSGVLHHVVNLEQLVDQVRGSLVPGGLFFFHDFVGPSRFRYAPAQYRMFEVIYERERKRRPKAELPPVSWMEWNMPQHSPFEAIRSSDTLGVLVSRMEPLSVRTVGAVTELLLFSRITRNVSPETQNSLTGRWLGKIRDRAFRPQAQPLIWERLLSPRGLKELILADELLSEAGWGEPGTALAVYRKPGS
jgi:SAM-dependent methyltransferase